MAKLPKPSSPGAYSLNVRFGSLADVGLATWDVRFVPIADSAVAGFCWGLLLLIKILTEAGTLANPLVFLA
jgi:hypothetical protein